jgi:hypothetical protein
MRHGARRVPDVRQSSPENFAIEFPTRPHCRCKRILRSGPQAAAPSSADDCFQVRPDSRSAMALRRSYPLPLRRATATASEDGAGRRRKHLDAPNVSLRARNPRFDSRNPDPTWRSCSSSSPSNERVSALSTRAPCRLLRSLSDEVECGQAKQAYLSTIEQTASDRSGTF